MDSDDMDMDSGMSSMYPENPIYAQQFWYIVAAATGVFACIRLGRHIASRLSTKRIRLQPASIPSRPDNIISQAIATTTAILRESTYWQPWNSSGTFVRFFNPPSAGRCIILGLYWLTILTMLFQNTILQPDDPMYVYKWEKMAFRAAWVNITQIPFIYLTATKLNPMSILSGISYERLNWIHRWASRTVFITVIFHWAYFFTEWSLADMVQMELQMMKMVTYGFASWAILGWQVLTSFGFFRSMCYELWVFQHLASAGILLWALYMHVPASARYNVWLSIAFVAFDQIGRTAWNIVQNVGLLRRGPRGMSFGYVATLEALPDGYTKVRIPDIHFTWKSGQHIYLSIPRIGPVEAHPFTIANDQDYDQEDGSRTVNLLIKAQSGFSRRIYEAAKKRPQQTYRAFLSGPWGIPPNISSYETVIFIANSTGATYNLPLFQQIAKSRGCARNVVFSWVCKESCQVSWFQNQILDASEEIIANGAKVSVRIGCTGGVSQVCCCNAEPTSAPKVTNIIPEDEEDLIQTEKAPEPPSCCTAAPPTIISTRKAKQGPTTTTISEKPALLSSSSSSSASISSSLSTSSPEKSPAAGLCNCICALRANNLTDITSSRPTLESVILPAVEAARGETAIICCGRDSLMAEVRNYVAGLSDERAVHKGSGAQGIFLWCESFGW